jgi:hypothetical protein
VSRSVDGRVVDRLRLALANKTLIPVVGAGVATAVARLPTWGTLLVNGIEYLTAHTRRLAVEEAEIAALKSLYAAGPASHMAALSQLQRLLARPQRDHWLSREYAAWLDETFGAPTVSDPGILYRLHQLQARVLVTTNYDLLLETNVNPQGASVTWEQPADLRALLRGGQGIIHLHGRFDRPRSVILSDGDYQRLVDDALAARVSQTLFDAGILLFIGVSPVGADDPHLGRILEHFADLTDPAAGEEHPHVLLHAADMSAHDRARLRSLGVDTLRYGAEFEELEAFLALLAHGESIHVQLDDVTRVIRSITLAPSLEKAVAGAAREIERWVYPELKVRVGFAELEARRTETRARPVLFAKYVFGGDTPCTFHYPLSVAGWAVAEGRAIQWPLESSRKCSLTRVRKLGRLEEVRELVRGEAADAASGLREYVVLDELPDRLESGSMVIEDVYQNWSNLGEGDPFAQFVSVPVPRVRAPGNDPAPTGVAVINIDSARSDVQLGDPEALEKLYFISDMIYAFYLREASRLP